MYHYTITPKKGGKTRLVRAGAKSTALSHVASGDYTVERVEGGALNVLKQTLGEPEEVGKAKEEDAGGSEED